MEDKRLGARPRARDTSRAGGSGGRRPGRPLRLPVDDSAPGSAWIDPWSRTAWVLATARSRHPDPHMRHRGEFATALRGLGLAADVTRVSKWESGHGAVPPRVLDAYEQLLGLTPASVVSLSRIFLRNAGQAPPVGGGVPVAQSEADLDHLIERAGRSRAHDRPQLTGAEWLRLAVAVTGRDRVILDSSLWTFLCDSLVAEVARTTGADELTRYEACSTLVEHERSRRPVLRALGEWLTAPDTQKVEPMIALLARVSNPAVDDLSARLLDHPSPLVRSGAAFTLGAKLARNQLNDAALARVEDHVAARLAAGRGIQDPGVLELVAALPHAVSTRVLADPALRAVRERMRGAEGRDTLLAPAHVERIARPVTARVLEAVEDPGGVGPDPLLARLVTEALFHKTRARRALANRTLSVSPFASAFVEQCLRLASGSDAGIATLAWEAVQHLGHGHGAVDVTDPALAEPRPALKALALTASGSTRGPLDERECVAMVRVASSAPTQDVRLAATSVVALRAPAGLRHIATRTDDETRAVRWWSDLGPRLLDEDSPVTGARR